MKKLFVLFAVLCVAAGCNDSGSPTDPSQVVVEFSFSDLTTGTGATAAVGNSATISYTIWLYDPAGVESKGARRQSSSDPGGQPFTFTIGGGGGVTAISGIDQGVRGMRVGGTRRIYVPPSMAYGNTGTADGTIPPNASVVFEIGLLSLQ